MQDFDELLNSVLEAEAKAGPLHGLETRVTTRVRLASARWQATRGWLAIGMAGALVSTVVATAPFWLRHASAMKDIPAVQVTAHRAPQASVEPVHTFSVLPQTVTHARMKRNRANQMSEAPLETPAVDAQLPKLNVFPSPATPTPGELALRRLAEHENHNAASAAASLQQQQAEPVHIAEIDIKPIFEERQ